MPPGPCHQQATGENPILFIDDDPVSRRAFARSARARGFNVHVAAGLEQALTLARVNRYAVVATDLLMPEADGLSAVQQLRAIQPQATYLLVTGAPGLNLPLLDSEDDVIVSIVKKPWAPEDLAKTLRRALRLHAKRAQRSRSEATATRLPLRLLLVEDNAGDALLIQRMLLQTGSSSTVEHVLRLRDALERLSKGRFDIIVSDLSLPDARGLDAVKALHLAAPKLPIVVLSGQSDEALALQALRLGAQDFVVKGEADSRLLHRCLCYAKERKSAELRLAVLANYDELTGLANRRSFNLELRRAVARARREGTQGALLFVDLNGFKSVNDSFGHDTGDRLLQHLGQRLSEVMRETDFVARFGGDEFAVIAERVSDFEDADVVAERIFSALDEPVEFEGLSLRLSGSVGIAMFPECGDSVHALLRAADSAMYRAKRAGGRMSMRAPKMEASGVHRALSHSSVAQSAATQSARVANSSDSATTTRVS